MYYSMISKNKYVIRLVKEEKIQNSIVKFCKIKKIKNATLLAIGSVTNPTLSYYNLNTRKYTEKKMIGDFELISFIGSIVSFENKPLVHAHISISNEHMQTFAGHLVEANVGATVEVILTKLESSIVKKYNEEIGLNLLDLPHEL
ncbi:DUF296 domain-containing protein [Candidatus Roizmanbacteria bacterium]|nr:DUF296 domain-containing protein [Candidatus Roizmanbacteria bacterium]